MTSVLVIACDRFGSSTSPRRNVLQAHTSHSRGPTGRQPRPLRKDGGRGSVVRGRPGPRRPRCISARRRTADARVGARCAFRVEIFDRPVVAAFLRFTVGRHRENVHAHVAGAYTRCAPKSIRFAPRTRPVTILCTASQWRAMSGDDGARYTDRLDR